VTGSFLGDAIRPEKEGSGRMSADWDETLETPMSIVAFWVVGERSTASWLRDVGSWIGGKVSIALSCADADAIFTAPAD
jgi:hypothetical protein